MRGLFLTFEGPEGSGKTSLARRLADRLTASGEDVLLTREPGGTAIGEALRALLRKEMKREPLVVEAEALLFVASRAQLVRQVVLPALARGAIVISDRFADSTTVYQGYARGLGVRRIEALNALAVGQVRPDLTFLLDLDPVLGLRRVKRREGYSARDRFERESFPFHQKVREGYCRLARRFPRRIYRVDASRPLHEVEEEVWKRVCERLTTRYEKCSPAPSLSRVAWR